MFYPQLKPHISPSALQAWHNNRSTFVRSYFMGIKSPETSAMKFGTTLHKLIEMGMYPAKTVFSRNEHELVVDLKDGILALGKPDSYDVLPVGGCVSVVDYKTGKEDTWSNGKIALDLKCKMTAWLVLKQARKEGYQPTAVIHYVEYIPTEWDTEGRELRPCADKESVLYEATFSAEELDAFTDLIIKTVDEVNEEYPLFANSTDAFVNMEDVLTLADIESQIKELEADADVIRERLKGQFEIGGIKTFSSPVGTVYITEKKSYEYPEDLVGKTEDGREVTAREVELVTTAMKVAKKNFEMANEPKSIGRSLAFRAKKK